MHGLQVRLRNSGGSPGDFSKKSSEPQKTVEKTPYGDEKYEKYDVHHLTNFDQKGSFLRLL